MVEMVSKSAFKARALEYFREVQRTGKPVVVSDRGKPALKIVPYASDPEDALKALRGSLRRYDDPLEPIAAEEWESTR